MTKEINLLVKQSIKGNQRAQLQLYDLHCEAMYKIAYRYLQNENDAKDAMQEGFIKAFNGLNLFTVDTNFSSWLKKIVINVCIDILKKRKLETISIDDFNIDIEDENDWNFDTSISKNDIITAIEKIELKYQIVLKLYLIDGFTHEEISDIIDIPIKTSRTRLHRGKNILRELLKYKKTWNVI